MEIDYYGIFRALALFFTTAMLLKYIFYMLVAPFYPVKEMLRRIRVLKRYGNKYKSYNPRISVIIPAWNEEVGIIKTIDSIVANGYPNTEIIVVPNACTDNTVAVVQQYIKNFKADKNGKHIVVKQYPRKQGGKGPALNYGIKHASGEIILTVDADSALDRHALYHLREYYRDPTIAGVVGNVKIAQQLSLIGLVQRLEYLFGFYFKRTNAVLGSEYIFGGACASFRASVFQEIGGYDEKNKTEDIEMSMRLRDAGYKCTYAEDVICYTEGASDLKGLVNQRLRWKKGRFDTFIRYRHLFFSGKKRHNKFLAWFVLPYALLAEFQLLFEPIAISLLVTYSFVSGDLLSLTLGILFVMVIYLVAALFTDDGLQPSLLLLFPSSWILFYFLVWVEYMALVRGLWMLVRGEDIVWQKWQRQGIKELS